MKEIRYVVGCYRSPHDRNGNPRRVFVLYGFEGQSTYAECLAYSRPIMAADEAYGGDHPENILRHFGHVIGSAPWSMLPFVDVPASEYRRILREVGK